jgi:hypothetical protein
MSFIHLVEILQSCAGNKLVGVGQAGSYSGNTPRLHLQKLVTGVNMYSDFTVLESASRPPSGYWCLNDKTIKELMTFAKCETGKMSYKLH